MPPSDPLPLAPNELVPAKAVALAGQGLSEHQTPYDAFVQIVDGVGTLRIGEKDVVAKAGEVVVMPAKRSPRRPGD